MQAFELEVNKRLDRIKDILKTISRVYDRREYVSGGDLREGYNIVLRNELNRMLFEIDDYKCSVAMFLGDVEATALLNHTRFPTFYQQTTGATGASE